jgi:hypothetical protein
MLGIVFWVAVGVVIGWNLPQPPWARDLQQRAVRTFNELTGRKG